MSDPQRDREAAALADLALDEYPAVVRIDELLGDGQSEAASLRLRTGHAEIAVENALMITRVYAATEILNVDIDPVVMLLGAHDDTGIFGRVVDRVGQQVGNDPRDLLVVDEQFRYFFRILHFHIAVETLG